MVSEATIALRVACPPLALLPLAAYGGAKKLTHGVSYMYPMWAPSLARSVVAHTAVRAVRSAKRSVSLALRLPSASTPCVDVWSPFPKKSFTTRLNSYIAIYIVAGLKKVVNGPYSLLKF